MEFTGERYVPSLNGAIKYEHLHRYAISLDFVAGKSVLDIASGEGYGSALLAKVAESVVGVDIDPASIEYSEAHYHERQNLKFLTGCCDSIPLPDNSVDVVTSFETIEHHDKHEEMMQEMKRVLKPNGILIISSPNRLTYSDEPNYSNPFHVKELYYNEFLELLERYFKHYQIYGQRLATSSFIYPLDDNDHDTQKSYTGDINNLDRKVCILKSPLYFIAVCSDEDRTGEQIVDSLYIDESDDIFKSFENSWHQQEKALSYTQSQLEYFQSQQQTELEGLQSQLQQAQTELEGSQSQLQQTQTELEGSQSQLQQTQAELERSQSQLQQTQAELERSQSQLQQTQAELERSQSQPTELEYMQNRIKAMETSKFWQMRKVWFRFRQIIGLKGD
jgi:ubiquinone/menaquinone biosynthesis C-methylase UbiE